MGLIKIVNISSFKNNNFILIFPAIIAFFVALILLYKFTYPISWDVYYHIHMANLYLEKGLVFWDYETVAPYGRLIMYPPLFHLIIGALSKLTGIIPIKLMYLLQPLCAFYLITVITYVANKLSDTFTAFVTGFLALLCFVTFNRSVISTPATIAFGLSMIACLLFYQAIEENKLKYYVFSAISLALIFNLHMATAIITIGVIGLYSLVELYNRNLNLKYIFIYLLIFSVIASPWWIYIYLNYTMIFTSFSGNNIYLTDFFGKYYGIIPTLLTLIGFYKLYKEKSDKSIFLVIWALSIIFLSQLNYLGFNIVSIRILELASYPLILIAGIGFVYLYENLIKNAKLKHALFIVLIILASLTSSVYVDSYTPDLITENDTSTTILPDNLHLILDPIGTKYHISIISSRYGNISLAQDRYDIMQWFMENKTNSIVVSQDAIMDTILVSTSSTHVIYGGFTESIPNYVVDPVHIIENHSTTNEINDLNIGYLLIYKNKTEPIYAQVVYTNDNYKICKIRDDYIE